MTWLYHGCSGGMRKWPVLYLSPSSFLSSCGVCNHILTAFSIKQWLLQRLFIALAVQRTSQSHLETKKACARFHWQPSCKKENSVWMEVSLQEAAAAISLQSIQAIKKEREKSIAKALSIPCWKDGKKHARKYMITFNCKLFSVSYSSCLAANEAEARISSSDLRW